MDSLDEFEKISYFLSQGYSLPPNEEKDFNEIYEKIIDECSTTDDAIIKRNLVLYVFINCDEKIISYLLEKIKLLFIFNQLCCLCCERSEFNLLVSKFRNIPLKFFSMMDKKYNIVSLTLCKIFNKYSVFPSPNEFRKLKFSSPAIIQNLKLSVDRIYPPKRKKVISIICEKEINLEKQKIDTTLSFFSVEERRLDILKKIKEIALFSPKIESVHFSMEAKDNYLSFVLGIIHK